MSQNQFTSANGRKPSTEARRYVYRVLAAALDEDLKNSDGWVRGGLNEFDDRRAKTAARKVYTELLRKAAR